MAPWNLDLNTFRSFSMDLPRIASRYQADSRLRGAISLITEISFSSKMTPRRPLPNFTA
jgi:hypothetical protein